ncbi:MAG TPA: hypothetical protein VK643_03770 [Burkholderiales bacterium]|nr:hypothetical protein [Burkholderiales bacterium]
MPVPPMEGAVDPAPILPVVPVDAVPVPPLLVPVLVLTLPAVLLAGARTTTGDAPVFTTSSEHGVEESVDSVAEVQRRSARTASPDGPGTVWASAEPASRSAASEARETVEDLFMAYLLAAAAD